MVEVSRSYAGIQMMNNKAILHIADPIFSHLAPAGSLLSECLIKSKWDDNNVNSASLAHYNVRLAISKLLQAITDDSKAENLIKIITRKSKTLTKKDILKGFKSAEVILKDTYPINRARNYSMAFRNFIKTYSSELNDGSTAFELTYESIFSADVRFQNNPEVSLFEIKTKGSDKDTNFVDPDLFPTLFKKNSVLHEMLQNIEANSTEKPMEYSVILGLKAQFRDIDVWPCDSLIKQLLNSSLNSIQAGLIRKALQDYECRLAVNHPNKALNQLSTSFRHYLFTYALSAPELIAAKTDFKTNFNQVGNLKFRPNYTITTTAGEYNVDSFLLASILPAKSVGEICFENLEQTTKSHPTQPSDVTKLSEILKLIVQNDHNDARLLLSKMPQDLSRHHVVKGLKEIDEIIRTSFPEQAIERFTLVKSFLNLCKIVTRNGKLISEIDFDSLIAPKSKPKVLPIAVYSKTNGKHKSLTYYFNLTKIADLLSSGGTLISALNSFESTASTTPPPSSMLSNIELTLGYIVEAQKNDLIKYVLTSPMTNLSQRDFRLAFSQLEDIIDEQDINTKAAKSQAIRTFLNKFAGKINNLIEIKNCGFSSRFSAEDENSAQKLIAPVNETGEILPSPILEQHVSLNELKTRFRDYLTKPIEHILEACKTEIDNYNKLLSGMTLYLAVNEDGNYVYQIPEQVSSLVIENQQNGLYKLTKAKVASLRALYTNEVLFGAYLRHQISSGIKSTTLCLEKAKLIPDYVSHWFPPTGTGMKDLFWSSVFLPKNILLVCFIRLTLRTTWNKDVIATLKRSDLPVSISHAAFTFGGFKQKVAKSTTPVTIEPHEREIREVISLLIQHYENMVSYGLKPESLWDTPGSTKLSFLSGRSIDNFREHYTLPYFRMELLAKHQINLRKGIDGDVLKSQMERNHGSVRVTAGYLSHPIAQLEYEANNADFQRRFETTVQFRDKKESLIKYGFDIKNVDTNLLVAPHKSEEQLPDFFLLPDGSSCTDIFASVDKSQKDIVCRGRSCHKGDGCKYNRVEIGIDEFVYTLRHQAYYLSRGMALLDKHGRDYFDEFIAPDMRFTFGLVKYVEFANPLLFKEAKGRLADAQ